MYSNLPLYLFYQFMKGLVKIVLALFYPRTKVTGREHLRLKGPTFIATNHPNTLLDAFNAAARVDEQVFFLANASLFKASFPRWFFNTFYCIRVERPQDIGGRPVNNEVAFARSTAHLEKGGHLYVAPEGTSVMERRLRPLKTGAARMSLTAENANDFELGVRILPIGLNYEQPNKFRSRLLVNVGAPIHVADFEADYRQDDFGAARRLTDLLEERMRALLIDTHSDEEDRLVRQLEAVLRTSIPTGPVLHFQHTKRVIRRLREELASVEESASLPEKVRQYFSQLEVLRLTDRAVAADIDTRRRPAVGRRTVALIIGFPFFLYGLINNFFPYFIPKWITRRLNLYVGYNATAKIICGLVSFPLFYGLQTWLVTSWWPAPLPLLYLVSLVPLGYFAHWYPSFYSRLRAAWRWRRIKRTRSAQAEALLEQRRAIGAWVEETVQM